MCFFEYICRDQVQKEYMSIRAQRVRVDFLFHGEKHTFLPYKISNTSIRAITYFDVYGCARKTTKKFHGRSKWVQTKIVEFSIEHRSSDSLVSGWLTPSIANCIKHKTTVREHSIMNRVELQTIEPNSLGHIQKVLNAVNR